MIIHTCAQQWSNISSLPLVTASTRDSFVTTKLFFPPHWFAMKNVKLSLHNLLLIIIIKNFNRLVTMAQSAANWRNTHTHVDRTHNLLTHLHQHSYNHFVRSAISAIVEFGIKLLFWRYLEGICICSSNKCVLCSDRGTADVELKAPPGGSLGLSKVPSF